MSVLKQLKKALDENSPAILAVAGVVGFTTAAIMAVKKAPEADKEMREAELPVETYPRIKKQISILLPHYAPAIGVGLVSAGLIFGSNRILQGRSLAATALYSSVRDRLGRVQEETVRVAGAKKAADIQQKVTEPHSEMPPTLIVDGSNTIFYDVFSDRYFNGGSIEKVRGVFNDLNAAMFLDGFASLNDYYFLVDLKPLDVGNEIGWSMDDGHIKPDFRTALIDGNAVITVDFTVVPKHGYDRLVG
jgi:hypothetical protein